ncbi:MAG: glycosyltransferase family 4 protein [Bacteroidetes bacterium]|nr:glycosyltransferase family 4 protein [Bacteroidota bacterium]
MILYAGNKLSRFGYTPTFIETLTPKLSEFYNIISVSDKKNQILRMLDMISAVVKNRKDLKLVLIDSYSVRAFWYTYILAHLCRYFNIPYIPILRGGGYPYRLESSPAKCRFIFTNSYKNISPSMYLKEHFEKKGYKVIYIPNFIPIGNYQYKNRTSARPFLLWVRSFHEIYNPLLAVEILKDLKEKYPDAKLCMIGPDKDGSLSKVKEESGNSGLNGSLIITGKLTKDEWTAISAGYDVFINTTNFDNHPVSVIEAMALGMPVISTDVGGIPYLINDRTDGILVPPGSKESFVNEIENFIRNPEFMSFISSNARKKVEEFDWENVKRKWFDVIDPLVKN